MFGSFVGARSMGNTFSNPAPDAASIRQGFFSPPHRPVNTFRLSPLSIIAPASSGGRTATPRFSAKVIIQSQVGVSSQAGKCHGKCLSMKQGSFSLKSWRNSLSSPLQINLAPLPPLFRQHQRAGFPRYQLPASRRRGKRVSGWQGLSPRLDWSSLSTTSRRSIDSAQRRCRLFR